jgi:mono/diheme cytochrome c family protein
MRMHVSLWRVLLFCVALACLTTSLVARQNSGAGDPAAAKVKNPVPATAESVAAGKKLFMTVCSSCHGADAKGGIVLSVIEDKGGNQPPDLTDDKWDHGATDGEIFAVIKTGIGPDFFMAPWGDKLKDPDVWDLINFLRSVGPKKN